MEYLGKRIWSEDPAVADDYRARYTEGIQAYIQKMNAECKGARKIFMTPQALVKDQDFYRKKYKEMLGMELFERKADKPVEMVYVGGDEVCKCSKRWAFISSRRYIYSILIRQDLPKNR